MLWGAVGLLFLASVLRVSGFPATANGVSKGPVVISELMAGPDNPVTDEKGRPVDWFELHNQGNRPVNLLGWTVSDNPELPDKWPLPDMTLAPGQYALVYAVGAGAEPANTNASEASPLSVARANFKLSGAGGQLGLYDNTSRRFIDSSAVTYTTQLAGKSYGLCADHRSYCYLDTPTPGAANDGSAEWRGIVAPVSASPERGFYDRARAGHPVDLHAGRDDSLHVGRQCAECVERPGLRTPGRDQFDNCPASGGIPARVPALPARHTVLYLPACGRSPGPQPRGDAPNLGNASDRPSRLLGRQPGRRRL